MLNKSPPELRSNILSRLPVDCLLRFRCISKSYYAEIDDPNFIKTHLKRSIDTNSNQGVIFADARPDSIYSVSFDSPDRVVKLDYPLKSDAIFYSDNIKIVGTCNGLLCFSNAVGRIALINPSTRKSQTLPLLPLVHKTKKKLDWSTWTLGFGYDPIGEDYKVVRLGQFIGHFSQYYNNETMIYNLKSNSWRKIPGMNYILGSNHKMGMLLGYDLHWMVGRDRVLPNPGGFAIVAFNLGTEKFVEVPEPDIDVLNDKLGIISVCVGAVGKLLSVSAMYHFSIDIWVMKEYGVKESWTQLVSVTPNIVPAFGCMRRFIFSKNDGDEFLMGMQDRNLVWYNLRNKTAKVMEMPADVGTPHTAEVFHGSLVPLNVNTKKPTSKKGSVSKGKKKNNMNRDEFLSKGFNLKL